MAVLLIAEHNNKELRPFTLNAATAASQIDTDVHAVIIGQNSSEAVKQLSELPVVKKVLSVELWNAIRTLPKKQRNVMNLRVAEGLSFKEVGVILNISDDAAKNNYSHGIKKLRKIMGTSR